MPFSLRDLISGGALPCAFVLAVCTVAWRLWSGDAARTIAANAAIAIGFLLGVRLLALSDWKPASHWQWLQYLGCLAAVLSVATTQIPLVLRISLSAAMIGVSAWLLTPTWKSLPLPYVWLVAIAGVSQLLLWLSLRPLVPRCNKSTMSIVLAGSAIGSAIVLTLAGSLRFGLLGGCIAASFSGLPIALLLARSDRPLPDVSLLFVVLIGGALFVGRLNSFSNVPLISYALPLLAPLTLWPMQLKPMSSWTNRNLFLTSVSLAALPVFAAIAIAAAASV